LFSWVKPVNPSFQAALTLIRENSECYTVQDASGVTMAWLFAAMTSNVAASAPANLPRRKRAGSEGYQPRQFMMQRQGF